jgi:O-antigen ligase
LLKDFLKASFLLLLLILPFNITYQLPYQILGVEIANPFVNGIIVNYLIPTLSILDLSVFLILISILLTKKIDLKWKGFSFLKMFILFAVYLVVQSIFKGSFLSLFNSFRLLIYLFTFYSLSKHIKSVLNQKTYIYLLIGSIFLVLFQGVVALLQFSGGTSLGLSFLGESQVVSGMRGSSFLELNNSLYLRGYGTFPHPNIFGGWLIFNILLGWFLFENMHKKRDYAVILMGISSLVLVLTFSRISLLVCLLIWIAFIVKSFVNSKRIKNFAFFGLISERFMNLFTGGDTSWSDRVGLMESSFHMIKQNLLTGVGLGGFIENMGDTVPRSSNGILLLQPVHNIFLLIVSEIGLVGFGLFSTLLYFFFKNRKWSLRFVMGLVGIFIISMFDHYLFSLPQGLGVFFFMVLL